MKGRNIKLIIEYDGTNYGGWQRQENANTIQGELERALYKLTGENLILYGAGRTDARVHARGQVANFFTSSKIPAENFFLALNRIIPLDIRIISSEEVVADFRSRGWARARHYSYSLVTGRPGIAIYRNYFYYVASKLSLGTMREALEFIKGKHDFKAFSASGDTSNSTIKTIYDANIIDEGRFVTINILGDGFLYNMVRIIAGTLIDIGRDKLNSDDIVRIIESRDRKLAGQTAPAQGLCLERIFYDDRESFSLTES